MGSQVALVELDHRDRLRLKQLIVADQAERTPVSEVMRLTEGGEMLPWDPTDPNQFFFGVHAGTEAGPRIGTIWGIRYPDHGHARLYNFMLTDEAENQGWGMVVLQHLEEWLVGQGTVELRLEIHQQDPLTQALLDRVGYRVDRVRMRKSLIRSRTPRV